MTTLTPHRQCPHDNPARRDNAECRQRRQDIARRRVREVRRADRLRRIADHHFGAH